MKLPYKSCCAGASGYSFHSLRPTMSVVSFGAGVVELDGAELAELNALIASVEREMARMRVIVATARRRGVHHGAAAAAIPAAISPVSDIVTDRIGLLWMEDTGGKGRLGRFLQETYPHARFALITEAAKRYARTVVAFRASGERRPFASDVETLVRSRAADSRVFVLMMQFIARGNETTASVYDAYRERIRYVANVEGDVILRTTSPTWPDDAPLEVFRRGDEFARFLA